MCPRCETAIEFERNWCFITITSVDSYLVRVAKKERKYNGMLNLDFWHELADFRCITSDTHAHMRLLGMIGIFFNQPLLIGLVFDERILSKHIVKRVALTDEFFK